MADVTFTVDGKKLTAPAGTLLIEACRANGIEIPAFCYYPGLSLQAACRMCVVRVEKMPKLQTACTTPVAEGMVVTTESPEIAQARKATIEMLLGNHPLDCPVCDAGGECELQDMTFKYGAHESKFVEIKQHRDEQQWSPVVFFDRPRCILCYRCVRVCGEGMDVWALGVQNRGAGSVIAPNRQDHLDCEECGMCIDICPVGALTSGAYRYKTRPWEMSHVGTVCTHCGDGCKTTLGVRRSNDGMDIVRGDNRDKSGINGDFLCIKGRYAFDFANREDRLTQPLVRKANGQLEPVSWDQAMDFAGKSCARFATPTAARPSASSDRTGPPTKNRISCRSSLAPFSAPTISITTALPIILLSPPRSTVSRKPHCATSPVDRRFSCLATILPSSILDSPGRFAPMFACNGAHLYVANHGPSSSAARRPPSSKFREDGYGSLIPFLAGKPGAFAGDPNAAAFREGILKEESLLIVFGSEFRGRDIDALVQFGATLPNVKFACLGDYANSRGAADMGLYPDLLPGYASLSASGLFAEDCGSVPPPQPGLDLLQMFDAAERGSLSALYVVGANPVARYGVESCRSAQHLPHRAGYVPDGDCPSSPTSFSPRPISTRRPEPSPALLAICSW